MNNLENYIYYDCEPLQVPCKKLIIMLHGLGSNGEDLTTLIPLMQSELPDYFFCSPDAIEDYDMAPFGKQWFSVKDRSPEVIMEKVRKNQPIIEHLISVKQKQLSLTNRDTILLGFSQGTMVASYLTLNAKEPFAAMIGFSGRMLPPYVEQINSDTPICLIHGMQDDVVLAQESQDFASYCHKHGIACDLALIPNLRHSIDHAGVKFALEFLHRLR
jgi:phospholipase/carboxylesterase